MYVCLCMAVCLITAKPSKIKHPADLEDFLDTCRRMSPSQSLIAKVTPKRIFSLDIHPSNHTSPLVAVGDKYGYVAMWNVVSVMLLFL